MLSRDRERHHVGSSRKPRGLQLEDVAASRTESRIETEVGMRTLVSGIIASSTVLLVFVDSISTCSAVTVMPADNTRLPSASQSWNVMGIALPPLAARVVSYRLTPNYSSRSTCAGSSFNTLSAGPIAGIIVSESVIISSKKQD